MPDVSTQLRAYIDGIADPLEVDEVQDAASRVRTLEPTPTRSRERRRWLLVAASAVVVALLGTAVVIARHNGNDVQTGPAQPPDTGQQAEFEVLGMSAGNNGMGQLESAIDPDQLQQLWESGGFEGDPPAVDFTRWVVVSMTIPDDACPPTLTSFVREGSTWTPTFIEPDGLCNQPLIPKTFAVAINRAMVTPEFFLRLSPAPYYGGREPILLVEVPPLDENAPPATGDDATAEVKTAFQQLVAQDLAADRLPVGVDERQSYAAAVLAGENPTIPRPPASADDDRPAGDKDGDGITWIYPDVSAPDLLAATWTTDSLGDQMTRFNAHISSARYDPNYSQSSDTGFEVLGWENVAIDGDTATVSAMGKFHKYRTPNGVVQDPADWIESDRMQIDATLVRVNGAWRMKTFGYGSVENSGP